MSLSQLVEIAFKVSNGREQVQEKRGHWRMRQQTALLAAALAEGRAGPNGGPPRGTRPKVTGHLMVGSRQCAYCKQEGHPK